MSINPDTLKLLRTARHLSQKALGELSGVSQKTISRIESGEAKDGTQQGTIDKLAKALDIAAARLANAPGVSRQSEGSAEERLRDLSLRKISIVIAQDKALAYELIAHRYDIPIRALFEVAPLCFTLLAELSLKKRRERLEEMTAAFETFSRALPHHLSHGHAASTDFDYVVEDEETSLRANDLFGAKLPDDMNRPNTWETGFDPDVSNPFLSFLVDLSEELGNPEVVDAHSETTWYSLPSYSVCTKEFEALAGGDARAVFALNRGYAHVADIPQRLLGDDAANERASWLADRVPDQKWEAEQKRWAEIKKMDLSDILGDLESRRSDTAQSSSSEGAA